MKFLNILRVFSFVGAREHQFQNLLGHHVPNPCDCPRGSLSNLYAAEISHQKADLLGNYKLTRFFLIEIY